ncbi:MAG: hypothetical protein ACQGVC_17165 [Myxococcota bacterium]
MPKIARVFCLPLLALCLGLVACDEKPGVDVFTPAFGEFVDAGSVHVTGALRGLPVIPEIVTRVDGAVVAVAPDGSFAVDVALDTAQVVQPVVVETRIYGLLIQRVVVPVVRGVPIAEDDFAPGGLGVRLTRDGLDAAGPGFAALLPVDLSELVPPGTVMFQDYCIVELLWHCVSSIDVVISAAPPPSFTNLDFAIDPHQDFARIDTRVEGMFVRADIFGSGIAPGLPLCSVNFTADAAPISADVELEPDSAEDYRIDAQLLSVDVGFEGFAYQNDCALGFLFDLLLPVLVGDVQQLAMQGFIDFMSDPDGPGPQDSILADLVEDTFAQVDIAGAFSDGLGADVGLAFDFVGEDDDGLTLELDTRVRPVVQSPDAVDLLASLHVPGTIPDFGALTPGGNPYDLGLCLSNTLLNQILKIQIEGGLLAIDVTEIEFFGDLVKLDAGLLGLFFEAFRKFPPGRQVVARVRPQLAPILVGDAGPAGELAAIDMAHMTIDFLVNDALQLSLAVYVRTGFDLEPGVGTLGTVVSQPAAEDVTVYVLDNPIGESETTIQLIVPAFTTILFPSLAEAAAITVDLPELLGLEIEAHEIERVGDCIAVYGDFDTGP